MAEPPNPIQQGWENYHGPVDGEGYIPAMPPAYRRGWEDALRQQPSGIEARLCDLIRQRQQTGVRKYGRTLADYPACRVVRVRHALEEACDLAAYLLWELEAAERESTCTCNDCCPPGPLPHPRGCCCAGCCNID
jgi:hypothetical protein